MANMYRDVNLSEVNESYIGKELKVAGWVENIRDHGGVSFIDLRDMYGVLQVVLRDTTLLDGIHKEECIAIEGIMEQRDEETYNPKIPSGTIELEAKKITILGQVYQRLPFEVQTSKEVREDVRLKYRYLDLRNQKVKDNMIFRSKVIAFLRQKMTDMGFLKSRHHQFSALHHQRVQEIILYLQENIRVNSMLFHRHHNSISSYLWYLALTNISRLHLASEMRMQELTVHQENSTS